MEISVTSFEPVILYSRYRNAYRERFHDQEMVNGDALRPSSVTNGQSKRPLSQVKVRIHFSF